MPASRSHRFTRISARAWFAWALSLAAAVLCAFALYLMVPNRANPEVTPYPYWLADVVTGVVFPAVGALIITRYPAHTLGWLFCVVGVSAAVARFTGEYITYTVFTRPGSLPMSASLAWVGELAGLLFWSFVAIPLLFPDGRLPSWRWRPIGWLFVSMIVVMGVTTAFRPGPLPVFRFITNPFGIEKAAAVFRFVDLISQPVFVVLIVFCVAAPFIRFRSAHDEERQQLKWFSLAVLLIPISLVGNGLFPNLAWLIGGIGVALIPVAIGIAILRYGLWNIDVIINRTLVYGLLSATLALIYFSSVVLLQRLAGSWGATSNSQFAVVVSTLAIAALFQPLRRRIQAAIDRRFYRRKYDAIKTLQAFSLRLRDNVDINRLSEDLQEVVKETMQPTHVSLWLRDVPRRRQGEG